MKKRILTGLAIAAIAFASCNDDQNVESNLGNNNEVQFTSGMSMSVSQSKVLGDQWEANDEIGVFMIDHGVTPLTLASADNVLYTTTDDGVGTANFSSLSAIVYGTTMYDFIAYYPYNSANLFASTVSLDVSDQTDLPTIDFMYACTNNGGPGFDKTTGTVDLPFEHKLAKVVFNVVAEGTTITDTEIADLKVIINDLETTGSYVLNDTLSTAFSLAGAASSSLQIEKTTWMTPVTGYTYVYEGIVLPQDAADHTISFDLKGDNTDVLTYTLDNPFSFEAGKVYTFNITVSRASLSLTGTIEPWDNSYSDTATIH